MGGRAVVVGAGVTGISVKEHLEGQGLQVDVIDDSADVLDDQAIEDLIRGAELVYPSAGVPPRHAAWRLALAHDVPVVGEFDLAQRASDTPVVAITASNGKTTITTLVTEMLQASGVDAVAAGNIGYPLIDAVQGGHQLVVAEASSFQLYATKEFRAFVALWANASANHLDWHGTFDEYLSAKGRIFRNQGRDDFAVANQAEPHTMKAAADSPARLVTFGRGGEFFSDGTALMCQSEKGLRRIVALGEMPRALPHDVDNALAALAVAACSGADLERAAEVLKNFSGLPHRVELVGEAGGVRWYNDSKATTPESVLAALAGFESVVLIAGGRNKGVDLSVMAGQAKRVRAVVAIGEAAPEVTAAFERATPVTQADSMTEAVTRAGCLARAGRRGSAFAGLRVLRLVRLLYRAGRRLPTGRDRADRSGRGLTLSTQLSPRRRIDAAAIPARSYTAPLTAIVWLLCGVGLLMVLSSSSVQALRDSGSSWLFFQRQAAWLALGGVAFAAALKIPLTFFRRTAPAALAVSYLLLVAVLIPGVGMRINGSTRWLGVGSLRFQPSELAKLALLIFGADLLARRAHLVDDPRAALWPVCSLVGTLCLLVMLQPDMGTTIVIVLIGSSLMLLSGIPVSWLLKLGTLGLGVGAILAVSAPYRRARVMSFLDPWADAGNTGYQVVQSLVGMGSGQLTGVGLGSSRAKWGFLPNAHTDFIFAIIGEELGLIGSLAIIALFVALAFLGAKVVVTAPDRFSALVAGGVTVWLSAQALINMGAVVGLVPVTGVPLPFVSSGGSALVANLFAAGLLVQVARRTARGEPARPRPRRAQPAPG